MLQGKFFFAVLAQMLALHLSVVPAWPFSSSKPTPTPTPTSATSALEASCKEHTERYHKYEWHRLVRPGGYLMQTAWKIGRGPQHWNRTATHFLGLANRLGWKPLLLIAPSDHKRKSNSIEFVYQKPLKRP